VSSDSAKRITPTPTRKPASCWENSGSAKRFVEFADEKPHGGTQEANKLGGEAIGSKSAERRAELLAAQALCSESDASVDESLSDA
jgi:hypothetical protein